MPTLKFSLTVTIEGTSLEEIDTGLINAATSRLLNRMPNPPQINGKPINPPTTGETVDKPAVLPLNLKMKIDEKVNEAVTSHENTPLASEPEKRRAGRSRKNVEGTKNEGNEETKQVHERETNGSGDKTETSRGINSTSGDSVEQVGLRQGIDQGRPSEGHSQRETGVNQSANQKDQVQLGAGQLNPTPELITLPTKDDAVNALSKVNSAKGIDAAREILTKFNAKRLGELPPEKFGAFIQACNSSL